MLAVKRLGAGLSSGMGAGHELSSPSGEADVQRAAGLGEANCHSLHPLPLRC
jgi:hypothetical protein